MANPMKQQANQICGNADRSRISTFVLRRTRDTNAMPTKYRSSPCQKTALGSSREVFPLHSSRGLRSGHR